MHCELHLFYDLLMKMTVLLVRNSARVHIFVMIL